MQWYEISIQVFSSCYEWGKTLQNTMTALGRTRPTVIRVSSCTDGKCTNSHVHLTFSAPKRTQGTTEQSNITWT